MSRTPEAVKHTPGPLQVISGPDGYSPAIALDDKRGAFIIAEMRDQMKGDDIVDATAERLVLAYNVHAEMLEALKAAHALWADGHALSRFDWGKSFLRGEDIRELNELPLQIRAAIAKAEGK